MILGLGGFAGSGKDAFADAMVEHDPAWNKTYMSRALELALLELDPYVPVSWPWHLPFPPRWIRYSALHAKVGYTESKKNKEVRRLLQNLGTEVGRNMFGQDVWVDKMMQLAEHSDFVIVTGVRYQNELDAIKRSGGETAWMHRPGVGPVNAHSSDNTLEPSAFDHQITNDGTLSQLSELASIFSDRLTNTHKLPGE